jgi:hypothetical protein
MNERTKAALIGGVVAGLLSAIPVVSTCCCLWAIGGGILAVFMYTKNTRLPVQPGDGAMLGAMTGGIAAVIYIIIALPLMLLVGMAQMEAQMAQLRQAGVDLPFAGIALGIVGLLIGAVGLVICATIGGLIGAPIFGKGAGTPPPPPPAGGYGGPAGGGPAAGGGSYGAGS